MNRLTWLLLALSLDAIAFPTAAPFNHTLPGDTEAFAYSSNDAGRVVGVSCGRDQDLLPLNGLGLGTHGCVRNFGFLYGRPFLWDGVAMHDLTPQWLNLPGEDFSIALSINEYGQIVGGGCAGACHGYGALLWDRGNVVGIPFDGVATNITDEGVVTLAFGVGSRPDGIYQAPQLGHFQTPEPNVGALFGLAVFAAWFINRPKRGKAKSRGTA
jgi:hypothetical protein